MKTLIWKEIHEYRSHLLLMMLFGLGSVGILSYNTMLDGDTLMTLLLVFANPVFILLFSQYMVSGEVTGGTFPFLAGLPIPRGRLWLGKLISVILFAALLTGFYAGLVMVAGDMVMPHYLTFMRNLPPISPLFLIVGFPLAMISIGFFATMLPGAPTVAVLTGSILVFVSVYLSKSLGTLNFMLFTPMLIASFLTASYQAFIRGELLQGWKPVLVGWGTLLSCILLSTVIWAGLDAAADTLPNAENRKIISMGPDMEKGSGMAYVRSTSPWWDPINDDYNHWMGTLDPKTGKITQIGSRGSKGGLINPEGAVAAIVSSYRFPGYIGSPRLLLHDMKTNRTIETIDTNAEPLRFMPDGSLFYTRRIETTSQNLFGYSIGKSLPDITELCRYKTGSKPRVIGSWSGFSSRPQILADRNQAIIHTLGSNLLIDLDTGKALRLAASESLSLIWQKNDRTVFRHGYRWESNTDKYVEITRTGEVIPQSWIPTGTIILESKSDKPIAWIQERGPWNVASQASSFVKDQIVQLDFETRTVQVLLESSELNIQDILKPKPDDKFLFVIAKKNYRFERKTATLSALNLAFETCEGVSVLGNDHWLVLTNDQPVDSIQGQRLWNLDLSTGEAREL